MLIKPAVIDELEKYMCVELHPTGSRFFGCAEDGAGEDWFCHVPVTLAGDVTEWLEGEGFDHAPSENQEFASWERNGLSVFVCWSELFFQKFRLASRVCKAIDGPKTREERVNVFRTIFRFE